MAADKTNEFYPLILRDHVSHLSRGPWLSLQQHLLLCVQLRAVWRVVERRGCPCHFSGSTCACAGGCTVTPNSWKTRSSPNFPCCPLPSWELPMAINCQASPELSCLRQKRLTPHLTQIAAWTGAAPPLTHSNAITASWSSARGAGAAGCHQGLNDALRLPSGARTRPESAGRGVDRGTAGPAALGVQNRARPWDLEERYRGHGGAPHSPGKETGDVAVPNTRSPGCPRSRPSSLRNGLRGNFPKLGGGKPWPGGLLRAARRDGSGWEEWLRSAFVTELGDPAGRREHPQPRPGGWPALPAAEVKLTPHRPRRRARASCPSVASLHPVPRSLPLGHRVEGRSSPSRALPSPPLGGTAASRRQRFATLTSTAPRCQPGSSPAPRHSRLLSQSGERSGPGDSLRSSPGGSRESPPSAGPRDHRALAPSAGPPRGGTLATARSGAEGREQGAQPSARASAPPTAGRPSPNRGRRGGSLPSRHAPPGARPRAPSHPRVPRVAPLGPASRGVLRKSR